jgi:hypothetical protein
MLLGSISSAVEAMMGDVGDVVMSVFQGEEIAIAGNLGSN